MTITPVASSSIESISPESSADAPESGFDTLLAGARAATAPASEEQVDSPDREATRDSPDVTTETDDNTTKTPDPHADGASDAPPPSKPEKSRATRRPCRSCGRPPTACRRCSRRRPGHRTHRRRRRRSHRARAKHRSETPTGTPTGTTPLAPDATAAATHATGDHRPHRSLRHHHDDGHRPRRRTGPADGRPDHNAGSGDERGRLDPRSDPFVDTQAPAPPSTPSARSVPSGPAERHRDNALDRRRSINAPAPVASTDATDQATGARRRRPLRAQPPITRGRH